MKLILCFWILENFELFLIKRKEFFIKWYIFLFKIFVFVNGVKIFIVIFRLDDVFLRINEENIMNCMVMKNMFKWFYYKFGEVVCYWRFKEVRLIDMKCI